MKPITVAKPLAPEDIVPGTFITVTREQRELVPWCFQPEQFASGALPVRICRIPGNSGKPMFVVEVCVPFVLARDEKGKLRLLDTRKVALARVSADFARAYLHAHRKKLRAKSEQKDKPDTSE